MRKKTVLITVKQRLTKTQFGRFLIKIYHYTIAIPSAKAYSFKFKYVKKNFKPLSFYSDKDMFKFMKENRVSFSRFGDGEISWINMNSKGYFNQDNSEELSEKLQSIILSEDPRVLIGVPNFFGELEHYSKKRIQSRNTHLAQYYKRWMSLLKSDYVYGDALMTRVYHGLDNAKSNFMFSNWKKIWENRDVIIIEGSQTRFGVNNDLLANVSSIKRIIAPAENAFEKYDDILSVAKEYISEDCLFLISLGPTATVLSYDLGIRDVQAIDIGHLDIEYEWYLSGANKKEPVKGKYVNEAGGSSELELPSDVLYKYKSEIVSYIE